MVGCIKLNMKTNKIEIKFRIFGSYNNKQQFTYLHKTNRRSI